MDSVSRRSILGTIVATGAVSVAGCSTGLLGGDDSESTDEAVYEEWLAAEVFADIETGLVLYMDVQEVLTNWPADVVSTLGIESMSTTPGITEAELEGMLMFQTGAAGGTGYILTGSFDQDALMGNISGEMEVETHGEYEVFRETVAVSSDAAIMSSKYAAFSDASSGDGDRITDVDDDWAAAIGEVAGAGVSGVRFDAETNFELMGIAMNAAGEEIELEAHTYYADAEAAEANTDEAETSVTEFLTSAEVSDTSVEGNVVVVTAVATDFSL